VESNKNSKRKQSSHLTSKEFVDIEEEKINEENFNI